MTATLVMYVLFLAVSVLLPIFAVKKMKKQKGGNTKKIFHGFAVYALFGGVIYATVSNLIHYNTSLGDAFTDSVKVVAVDSLLNLAFVSIGLFVWIKCFIKDGGEPGDCIMTGFGFGTALVFIRYTLTVIERIAVSAYLLAGKSINTNSYFASTAEAVMLADPYTVFLEALQMCAWFVIGASFAAVFYRVILFENKKRWLLLVLVAYFVALIITAAEILMVNSSVAQLIYGIKDYLHFVLGAIALTVAGAAYALAFPWVKKEDEETDREAEEQQEN